MVEAGKGLLRGRAIAVALCSVLSLGAITSPALAKKADREKPILTFAKVTNVDDGPNGVTTLTGQVKVTQGTLVVTGDVARLYYDANQQLARAVVTGRPAHMQELDEQGRLVQADADSLDYDNLHQIAVLTRNATVKVEGQGDVRGDTLTYNVDTTELKGESSSDNLVHGVMLPQHKVAPESGTQTQP